jgi:HK97 family phage portal protein
VWACIDVIARNIASQKFCIYEPVPGTKRRKMLDDDVRTWMLNTRPNPEMTAIGFREAMLYQVIPFGNAYAEIVRDAGGRVLQLWPLMSDRVMPKRDRRTWALVYQYTQPDGEVVDLTSRQVLHFRGPGLWGLMGENIVARAAKTIAVAAAQERYSAAFFGQGAQPIGTLNFPGKLTPEKTKELRTQWAEKYQGPENSHKPLILESGMKFESISVDAQKSQLTEGKKFSVEEICRWFGVPPHKVQHLEHATFSNIEHSSIEFVRDALTPWERRLCQEIDFKLLDQNRGAWRYSEIDLRPLMRGDAQSRALAAASFRQNGIKSANEIRAEEGLDDAGDDGDVLLVQSNMTTVENIVDPPEAPASRFLPADAEPEDDDDDDELDPSVESVNRLALQAALTSVLARYERRVQNRRASVLKGQPPGTSTTPEQDAEIDAFRGAQFKSMADELRPFSAFAVVVLGRELTEKDMAVAASLHDGGAPVEFCVEQALKALPAST